jgi:hypothetical protein
MGLFGASIAPPSPVVADPIGAEAAAPSSPFGASPTQPISHFRPPSLQPTSPFSFGTSPPQVRFRLPLPISLGSADTQSGFGAASSSPPRTPEKPKVSPKKKTPSPATQASPAPEPLQERIDLSVPSLAEFGPQPGAHIAAVRSCWRCLSAHALTRSIRRPTCRPLAVPRRRALLPRRTCPRSEVPRAPLRSPRRTCRPSAVLRPRAIPSRRTCPRSAARPRARPRRRTSPRSAVLRRLAHLPYPHSAAVAAAAGASLAAFLSCCFAQQSCRSFQPITQTFGPSASQSLHSQPSASLYTQPSLAGSQGAEAQVEKGASLPRTRARAAPLADQVAVFRGTDPPKSPVAKLLLLLSMLYKGGRLNDAQKDLLKDKVFVFPHVSTFPGATRRLTVLCR